LRNSFICLSVLAMMTQPGAVRAGGSAPEESTEDSAAQIVFEPSLDAHERRAATVTAVLARSRALQDQAELTSLPAEPTVRMRPAQIWKQSHVVARTRRLSLPASGRVSRGYDRRTRHYGLDIQLERNAPIFAAAPGVVVRADWDNTGYGRMVWIDHGGGLRTLYAHLNAVLVEPGQTVQRGQMVGLAGSSGHSSGPHLHFEVKQDKVKLDPLAFYPDGRAPFEDDFIVASSPGSQEDKRQ
jgi:murein DD-endopeptidase MepM/ murein hydrolase activator NlpD